jgi:hypothetical protein
MMPDAHVAHSTSTRLRIKIPAKRGDGGYFSVLQDEFVRFSGFERVEVSAAAASILFVDPGIDRELIAEVAETRGLFKLVHGKGVEEPIARRVIAPLEQTSRRLKDFTGDELDLTTAVFVTLLGVGTFQVLRGNLTLPPWYTAFWYALGVFTKLMVDKADDKKRESGSQAVGA